MKRFLTFVPVIVVFVLSLILPEFRSYAVLPIAVCGMLSINLIVRTIQNGNYATNAYFYTWIFIFISTYVAPLIHFAHNYWVPNMQPRPYDWTSYAFITSMMYLVGIFIWRRIFNNGTNLPVKRSSKQWTLSSNWKIWITIFLLISLFAQLYVYSKFGGISGYIHAFTVRSDDSNAFAGMGLLFILSESFPYTLLIYLIFKFRNRNVGKLGFYLMLLLLFVVTIFFGGLRGSRSNTILFMVISTIAINIYIYRVQKKDIILLLIGFFIFMFVGRMYKDYGEDMLLETTTLVQANTDLSSIESTITGDLSRYDVNAYQLFLLNEVREDYPLRYGETYLWGALTFVPGGRYIIHAFGLKGRSSAAAELFFGSTDHRNSRILGPLGEWFINFGRYSFFMIYIIVGLIIRYIRRYTLSIDVNDVRFMLVPSLMVFLPQLILSDFSNIAFFFVKRVVVVVVILYVISKKSIIVAS